MKKREDELLQEIEEKQKQIDDLKMQALEKIKENEHESNGLGKYSQFLELRLAEALAENRRMLGKYSEMRSFAYQ